MDINGLRKFFRLIWILLGLIFIPIGIASGFKAGKTIGIEVLIAIMCIIFDLVFKYAYKDGYWNTESGDIDLPDNEQCDLTYRKRNK